MNQNENLNELVNEMEKSELPIHCKINITLDELRLLLAEHIHTLITKDFSRLIAILYRLDISEKKLKELLQHQSQNDAGLIIADMIIERQLQKIESRKKFNRNDDIAPDDKW